MILIITLFIFDIVISILLGIFYCAITLIDIWLPLFTIATAIMVLLVIIWQGTNKELKARNSKLENLEKRELTANSKIA